ncbi:hypothetical protein H632_c4242p0, partial [Helicosporidium sp. ATCC 50920]
GWLGPRQVFAGRGHMGPAALRRSGVSAVPGRRRARAGRAGASPAAAPQAPGPVASRAGHVARRLRKAGLAGDPFAERQPAQDTARRPGRAAPPAPARGQRLRAGGAAGRAGAVRDARDAGAGGQPPGARAAGLHRPPAPAQPGPGGQPARGPARNSGVRGPGEPHREPPSRRVAAPRLCRVSSHAARRAHAAGVVRVLHAVRRRRAPRQRARAGPGRPHAQASLGPPPAAPGRPARAAAPRRSPPRARGSPGGRAAAARAHGPLPFHSRRARGLCRAPARRGDFSVSRQVGGRRRRRRARG